MPPRVLVLAVAVLLLALVAAAAEQCDEISGQCSTSCDGQAVSGLCTGGADRRCCFAGLPSDRSYCEEQSGTCVHAGQNVCANGQAVAGLCRDSSRPQCCGPTKLIARGTERVVTLSAAGISAIVDFETGGKEYYDSKLARPSWPGFSSGVTVGVGFDLGYTAVAEIEKAWKGKVPDSELEKYKRAHGKTGQKGKAAVWSNGHRVPYDVAKGVFREHTIPLYVKTMVKAFPNIDDLPPDGQAMVLSIVFNRGTSMKNTDKRKEMREIRDILLNRAIPVQERLNLLAGAYLRMRRHWSKSSGLYPRRTKEAQMLVAAMKQYSAADLLVVKYDGSTVTGHKSVWASDGQATGTADTANAAAGSTNVAASNSANSASSANNANAAAPIQAQPVVGHAGTQPATHSGDFFGIGTLLHNLLNHNSHAYVRGRGPTHTPDLPDREHVPPGVVEAEDTTVYARAIPRAVVVPEGENIPRAVVVPEE